MYNPSAAGQEVPQGFSERFGRFARGANWTFKQRAGEFRKAGATVPADRH